MQTITHVYDTYQLAADAVRELEAARIPSDRISIVTSDEEAKVGDVVNAGETEAAPAAGFGAVIGGAVGLLTGLGVMAIPGVGPVVAAGWLATTALGAVAGGATGGLVGSLINEGVPEDHAHLYLETVRRGGSLVSVRVDDRDANKVREILSGFNPLDLETQKTAFRSTGWSKFEPDADPYIKADRRDKGDARIS